MNPGPDEPRSTALHGDDPEARRRRWLVGIAVVAIAGGAAAFGVRHTRATPACPSAQPELDAQWSKAEKAGVAAAFRATHVAYAEDAIRGVSSALDAYGARWVAMRGEACEASRLRGEQSSELMDLRMQCLRLHLGAVRALVLQLTAADAKTVESALQGAQALPAMGECADVVALRAPVRLPSDPTVCARIDDVRGDLVWASALQQTSHYAEARDLFARSVMEAKVTEYAPLEAEALSAQGGLFLATEEAAGAIAAFDDAVLAAVAGRQESVEAHAWIELVRAYALAGSWAAAHEAARHARAALARNPDELRRATLLRNEGFTWWREGKLGDARDALERARALFEKLLPPDHPDLALVSLYLANVLNDQGRYDDGLAAARRALDVREHAFGASHPSLASPLQAMGNALQGEGDVAGAEAAYHRSRAIVEATHRLRDRDAAWDAGALK